MRQRNHGGEVRKCADCKHTVNAHTTKAHNHEGGCAYCKCARVLAE